MDWKKEIGIAFLVRKRLSEVDALFPLRYPNVAATETELAAARLAHGPLDREYEGFLRAANGWEAFHQTVDVFGTADLVGSPRMYRAQELLSALAPLEQHGGVNANEVLPVAVAAQDIDLFLLEQAHDERPGKVYWWAGQLIEEFDSFSEFFRAIVDLARRHIQLSEHHA